MVFGIKNKKEKESKYYSLTEKEYYKIGKKNNLEGNQLKVYVAFMKKRFPNERHEPYADEWAKRFSGGNPEVYMDEYSLKAYKEVKGDK